MSVFRKSVPAFAAATALVGFAAGANAAVTYNTVGVYDEQVNQTNAVDRTASGDLNQFKLDVAAAFTLNRGGVINFDLPNGANANALNNGTAIEASYGAAPGKVISITPNVLLNHTSFSSLTPISGVAGASRGIIPSVTNQNSLTLNVGTITGGEPGEALTQVGFTILSRNTTVTTTASVTFSGGGSTVTAIAFPSGTGSNDTFVHFAAPTGESITSISLDFAGPSADSRLGVDDFGFITSPVPEPGSLAALAVGAGATLLRRRRNR